MHGPPIHPAEAASADARAFEHSTTNHSPSPEAVAAIESFRADVQDVALKLILKAPRSRARSVALTHLEDAVMWGVKAIILDDQERHERRTVGIIQGPA